MGNNNQVPVKKMQNIETEQSCLTNLPDTNRLKITNGLSRWCHGKESTGQCRKHRRCSFHPWTGKMPWRRKGQPTPVFFRKFHAQRSPVAKLQSMCLQRVRHDWTRTHTHYSILAIPVFRNSDSAQKGELTSASCGAGCRICDSLPHMFGVLTGCLKWLGSG